MTSVVERQLESWLDSQSERRYQGAFVQLLATQGWTVLHNTRHSPIELGKDVIARDPQGVIHCFQLKGNPSSRLRKSEARAILPQVLELLELRPPEHFLTKASERHVAVLVTNGEIDEEAQLELSAAGARTAYDSCAAFRFDLWSRGRLLQMFGSSAGSVWPTSPEGSRSILNTMAQDGRDCPSATSFGDIFAATAPPPKSSTSAAERTARLTALLLVAEIAKAPWYRTENHYGLYVITVLASVYALQFADSQRRLDLVRRYAMHALEHAGDLLKEAHDHDYRPAETWAESDPLTEFDVMWERRNLVGECAAVLELAGTQYLTCDQSYARGIVSASFFHPRIWGLAAIPSLIVRYWAVTRWSGEDAHLTFGKHLQNILDANLEKLPGVPPLASPYYDFEACWARLNEIPFFSNDSVFDDSFTRRVWFARPMMLMLAKRNWMQTCKQIWPSFSRLVHEEPNLPASTFFNGLLAREGQMKTYSFHAGKWDRLLSDTKEAETSGEFLDPFGDLAWLLAAYVAVVPYRAWTSVLMWLDRHLNKTWY